MTSAANSSHNDSSTHSELADTAMPDAVQTPLSADSKAIISLARAILSRAVRLDAGYLFVEPGAYDLSVGFRTVTGLELEPALPWRVSEPLLARFRILAGLDPAVGSRVRSGSYSLRCRGKYYRVTVTCVPSLQGEVLGVELRERFDAGPSRSAGLSAIKQAYKSVFRPKPQS